MNKLNQLLLDFDYKQNFQDDDFYVSKSNKHIIDLLNKWPQWEKNILNISGEHFSGKTHLINIFLKKFKGYKLDAKSLTSEILSKIKTHQNIVLENLNKDVDEKILYSLFNIIDQDNKYMIITSLHPISEINFNFEDVKSRSKSCLLLNIENPDDDLMFALILKNLSDRQISIDQKLINYIIKRIERSYGKISNFIYKIDKISLKKKNQLISKLSRKF